MIVAVADNITDSLSVHVYQESENIEERAALRATLTNFAARLLIAASGDPGGRDRRRTARAAAQLVEPAASSE
ncbi:MAG TPA: hypothetical protein VFA59_24080 [Vicinamibacterales bacterium]|nr:hypothetical protein [Vicinamibacterales bacterium]